MIKEEMRYEKKITGCLYGGDICHDIPDRMRRFPRKCAGYNEAECSNG